MESSWTLNGLGFTLNKPQKVYAPKQVMGCVRLKVDQSYIAMTMPDGKENIYIHIYKPCWSKRKEKHKIYKVS